MIDLLFKQNHISILLVKSRACIAFNLCSDMGPSGKLHFFLHDFVSKGKKKNKSATLEQIVL